LTSEVNQLKTEFTLFVRKRFSHQSLSSKVK
jgi:hypothetical protein